MLYTGPVVLSKVLPYKLFANFMTLSVAIRIVCSEKLLQSCLDYAEELLGHFVISFSILYGDYQVSHNVHGLIHLCGDVINFGALDNFSAFRFENYMQTLKKLIRKSDKPLQQLCRRYVEIETNSSRSHFSSLSVAHPNVSSPNYDGPLLSNCSSPQYKKLSLSLFTIDVSVISDNCCQLVDGSVVLVSNIATYSSTGETMIIGQEFQIKEDYFLNPCNSSHLNIYRTSKLSKLKCWPIKKIICKNVIVPLNNDNFVVFPLIHCET